MTRAKNSRVNNTVRAEVLGQRTCGWKIKVVTMLVKMKKAVGGVQATADKRTNIELNVLKQTIRKEAVQFGCIDARVMLAGCLTKVPHKGPRTFLESTFVGSCGLGEVVDRKRGQNIQRSAQEVLEILAGQVIESPITAM